MSIQMPISSRHSDFNRIILYLTVQLLLTPSIIGWDNHILILRQIPHRNSYFLPKVQSAGFRQLYTNIYIPVY